MRRFLGFVAALALFLSAGQARASSILYFVDANKGTDEMAAALAKLAPGDTTTVASSPLDFATKIASGTYNLGIFSQQLFADFANPYTNANDYTTALTALATYVQGGGKAIVDTWNPGSFDYVSAFGADYTGDNNGPAVNMTAFNTGVTNPVNLSNPGWSTFSAGQTLDAATGSSIAGTYFDPGNASGTNGEGAVVVGNSGRSIVNGFLNDTAGAPGEQIYVNEINALLPGTTTTPEPATLGLLATGLATLAGYGVRRRRRSQMGRDS
jgi:hypothetical protein